MVVIRLTRGGKTNRPFYWMVVTDSRQPRDGRFIEEVGFYNPTASGAAQPLNVKFDRITHWVSLGAQMSPTVARLVKQCRATSTVAVAVAA
jgi:small subunit ribosomal protein S16